MKYIIAATIKKKYAEDIGYAYSIPSLNIYKRITHKDKKEIRQFGMRGFIRLKIHNIINQREAGNQTIQLPQLTDDLLDRFFLKFSKSGRHDYPLNIEVEYRSKKGFHFFSDHLPGVTKFAFLLEILSGTIISIASLRNTEGALIPMDANTSRDVSITQAALSTLLNAFFTFAGPGIALLSDSGELIDNGLYSLWKKISCQSSTDDTKKENNFSLLVKVLKKISQILFCILFLNFLWQDANYDYFQLHTVMKALSDSVTDMFPSWVIPFCAWTNFIANQLNDPAQFFTMFQMGMKIISKLFSYFFEPNNTVALEKKAELQDRETRFYQRQAEPKPWMKEYAELKSSTQYIDVMLERPPLRKRPRVDQPVRSSKLEPKVSKKFVAVNTPHQQLHMFVKPESASVDVNNPLDVPLLKAFNLESKSAYG